MSPLPGFRKIPGRAERYKPPPNWRGPTGPNGTISRRQYENYRLKLLGWYSWSEYQFDSRTDDYRRWKGEYAENLKDNSEGSYVGPNSEFAQAWIDAKRSGWSKDPDGDFADLLVLTGHRDANWEWDIGETNIQMAA